MKLQNSKDYQVSMTTQMVEMERSNNSLANYVFHTINFSHMSFYTCFDWFKKLRLFSYVLNLKIDVVLKVLHAVVNRRFSLNKAPLRLFKFISDYLPNDMWLKLIYMCLFVVVCFCFSSSCVPYVASFSELSIFDCPFGIIFFK
jgi:hypothetical protein